MSYDEDDDDMMMMNNSNGYGGGDDDGLGSDFNLLERVRIFVSNFYKKIFDNTKVSEVRGLYHKEWVSITHAYYKDTEWPRSDEVASLCDNNPIFLLLYSELYYRHIFVNGEPMIHHRFESWNNYRQLFDLFLSGEPIGGGVVDGLDNKKNSTKNLVLPAEWLNDMIDEFLYQFQDFCRYKHDLQSLSEEERKLLEENTNVWQTETVLYYLTSFVQKSNIINLIEQKKGSGGALNSMRMNVLQSIGYFSLFGLCRLHCLLADYRLSVDVLKAIDIDDKRAIFTRVPACHITFFYYLGFSYLMMRRYADAVSVFSAVLLAHRGSKDRHTSFADSQIPAKYDKIRALTAIAHSLCPGIRMDQQVHYIIFEKHGDNMSSLMRRDEETFEKLFNYSCPKFIVPGIPDFKNVVNRHQEAYGLQLKWFLYEVRQQKSLPTIRSYLKLYTSITISKLAKFCDMTPERFREYLLSLKFSANQKVHQDSTAPLDGTRLTVNDVHFYIVGDMVFIDETKQAQRYGQYFLTHALKFQQAIDDLTDLHNKKGSGPKGNKKHARSKQHQQ